MQVVQLEVLRSSNVVEKPMAKVEDQINTTHVNSIESAPLEPIMECIWPLAPPGSTIGSTRASRTGWAHGKRQKALEERINRSPMVKRETIILSKESDEKECDEKERRDGANVN